MSTRSAVGIPDGDGWKARYVHMDGYPLGVGLSLNVIVARDGLDKAIDTIVEKNVYWSTLDGRDVDSRAGWNRDRSDWVPGYGEASPQMTDVGFIRPGRHEDWVAWVYVMCESGLLVAKAGDIESDLVPWSSQIGLAAAHDKLQRIQQAQRAREIDGAF